MGCKRTSPGNRTKHFRKGALRQSLLDHSPANVAADKDPALLALDSSPKGEKMSV